MPIRRQAAGALVAMVACIGPASGAGPGAAARGEAIVTEKCGRCHAAGRTGASAHPSAPPFRYLGRRFPVESLAESLAEGLQTGHPDMPEFVFTPREIDAVITYLKAIQVK
jgi:mono/diheme cytochrome c family protein